MMYESQDIYRMYSIRKNTLMKMTTLVKSHEFNKTNMRTLFTCDTKCASFGSIDERIFPKSNLHPGSIRALSQTCVHVRDRSGMPFSKRRGTAYHNFHAVLHGTRQSRKFPTLHCTARCGFHIARYGARSWIKISTLRCTVRGYMIT